MKKIFEEIKSNKLKIGKIVFLPDDRSFKNINKQVLKSVKKLKYFYNINISDVKIELVYSRKEFNEKMKRKTPRWLVGSAFRNNIYLLSPSVVEEYSSHKSSDLNKIITHELCHIFNSKVNGKIPLWLDEGSALFLSGQRKKRDFKKSNLQFFVDNLNKNISLNSFAKHDGYKISYWLLKKINDKYNKKELLKIIKKPSLIREGLPC